MKKIRLNLEQLTVESFSTERDRDEERGTIRGHDSGIPASLDPQHCVYNPTFGTGEIYCVCVPMVQPADTQAC